MKNGICPKCSAASVYTKKRGAGFEGGLYVYTSILTSGTDYISYVCTSCGYFENYISDPSKLLHVEEKWDQVPPRQS